MLAAQLALALTKSEAGSKDLKRNWQASQRPRTLTAANHVGRRTLANPVGNMAAAR